MMSVRSSWYVWKTMWSTRPHRKALRATTKIAKAIRTHGGVLDPVVA